MSTITSLLLLLSLFASPSHIFADSPQHLFTLQELIDSAMRQNSEVLEGEQKVAEAAAKLRQARAARFLPRLRLESENGLVPDAEGDLYNPPNDTTGWRGLGPFNRTRLEFVQPLFTFGQLSSLRRAAEGGVQAERADLAQTHLDIALEVKKLYYGLLLAQDLQELGDRLAKQLDEELADIDRDALSLTDRYKLELALLELDKQRGEATRQLALARAALAWKAGLPESPPIALKEEWLQPATPSIPPQEQLFEHALAHRPDWRQLQVGIAARSAQEDAARSAYYPQIFLAGGVRYALAPGRTDQHNPFIKDEFNYFNGGIFLGLRQSFEWGMLGADLDKARAVRRQLQAQEAGAEQGIRLDIRRATLEQEQAGLALDTATRSRQLARQWLQEAQDEYEFDPDSLKGLIDAFEAWARLEQDYYRAIYDFNISLAELEKAAGGIALNEE